MLIADIRDRALLLFAFSSGGRRRSEVAVATLDNLVKADAGAYIYRLTHSKTDQAGSENNADADKPLVGRAAQALEAWLAGLVGDFGTHSLRSGFVTEAGRQNVPLKEAMGLTGHRSLATFLRYFQSGAIQHSRAARILEDPDAC
jgi:integrase